VFLPSEDSVSLGTRWRSKDQFKTDLHLSARTGIGQLPKRRSAQAISRKSEIRMIEDVEKLPAELEAPRLVRRGKKGCLFHHREIHILITGSQFRIPAKIAKRIGKRIECGVGELRKITSSRPGRTNGVVDGPRFPSVQIEKVSRLQFVVPEKLVHAAVKPVRAGFQRWIDHAARRPFRIPHLPQILATFPVGSLLFNLLSDHFLGLSAPFCLPDEGI